jgi:endosialidase-like protein
MFIPKHLIVSSLFAFLLAGTALAQEARAPIDNPPVATPPLVTATATAKRVRFVSPGTVVQLRLEVYNEAGQKLFDTELRGGNVLDWHLQDGAGEQLAGGSYACVLTIKSLSGRLSQRVGVVTVNKKKAAFDAAGAAQLSLAQQQTIGPVEGNAGLTIRQQNEAEAITAVTHDGTDGQLTSTTGALTFRTGDVFAGKDKEHMRITEDGRVGIGTDKPEAALDVAGTVRVSDGVKFSDGTTLNASSGKLKVSDANGKATEALQGTGSENRIAKWTDNAGTLGDAAAAEISGMTIFGQNGSGQVAPLFPTAPTFHVVEVVTTGNKTPLTLAGGSGVLEFWKDLGSGMGPAAAVAFGMTKPGLAATNDMVFSTFTPAANWNERMRITTAGDLGIGTNNPGSKLDVAGNINTSTQYNIGGNRVFSVAGTSNTFAGTNAGNSNTTGFLNSFFGSNAGAANTSGSSNSFFGPDAGRSNTTGSANSFFGESAGLMATSAANNSFFGARAGVSTQSGHENSFFGASAGLSNETGIGNSFFGSLAGFANTTASSNSFFGHAAGISNSTGGANSFFGASAGTRNDTGDFNSFFGTSTGFANTTGRFNAFFGTFAGVSNTTASNNSFFGYRAGINNSGPDAFQNSFFGSESGQANSSGNRNSFFGFAAGLENTTACCNSFFGHQAGQANTTGENNAFFGNLSGNATTSGKENAFFGAATGQFNTTGERNSFFGNSAGSSNTTGGANSFFGNRAGEGNSTGPANSFFGNFAGQINTTGGHNAFFGNESGNANTTGSGNVFFGSAAGFSNTVGNDNTLVGHFAGSTNTTGLGNILIGRGAGPNVVAGSDNIHIGNAPEISDDLPDESNRIRIGRQGTQTATFIAGISGTVVAGDAVLVNGNGQLGVLSSSRRFKQDIAAMGRASSKLMQLRPVVFHYRPEYVNGKPTVQYGLIAEEVAKVFPELVGFGADGKPQTVHYHLLNTMLLNEMQKQEGQIRSQAQQLESQAQQITDLEARLRRLEAQATKRQRR